ncbi:N-acetyltransferase [Rhizocola hellebori]|uniref:N-acetyltransferase n=1 Tax=Rhizocola hellebori TaxID=1392758 RepID=A0A8J3VMX6_9ACTN|nr:GNAT family N-acetyltransferase [Rhizocola hellebori]GIH11578.1 N-acetyltransferase [Rhizocola hellebori]
MTEVRIRRATEADIPGLVESSVGLFAEDAGTRDPTLSQLWPREHGPDSFRQSLDDPERLVLVVDDGDSVVGHLTAALAGPTDIRPIRVATLGSMYVFPEHRSLGVGTRLVAEFRQWARDAGADRIAVTAYTDNDSAIKFYVRQGFRSQSLKLEDKA